MTDTADVMVEFVPLLRRPEDGEWIVGRAPAGPFIALPDLGVEAIDLLEGGRTIAGAARELHQRHGDPVDVAAFVAGLDRVGLVATIAGRPTGRTRPAPPRGATLPWLRPAHLRWLPTRATVVVWCALVGAAVAVLALRPSTRPHLADLVWAPSAALVTAVNLAVLSLVIFLHECGHLALARAYGVPATISVSTRLTFVVAQTDVTGAWALPRRRRIAIYLVGMAVELALAALAILGLIGLDPAGTLAVFTRATVLSLGVGVLLQFAFYLRTDVFFLVQDLTRCRDLYGDSRRLLRYWLARHGVVRRSRPDPRAGRARHERRAITLYAPLLVVGVLVTLGLFVVVSLPVAVRLTGIAVGDVSGGLTTGSYARVADGVVSLAVLAGLNGTLLVLTMRKLVRAVRTPLWTMVRSGDARPFGASRAS